jgi:hypothetical protein
MALRNFSILHHYIVSEPRRQRLEFSLYYSTNKCHVIKTELFENPFVNEETYKMLLTVK